VPAEAVKPPLPDKPVGGSSMNIFAILKILGGLLSQPWFQELLKKLGETQALTAGEPAITKEQFRAALDETP
jgi:hypothetical protein